jgi:tetratricopeptide (TPR) repeat protein
MRALVTSFFINAAVMLFALCITDLMNGPFGPSCHAQDSSSESTAESEVILDEELLSDEEIESLIIQLGDDDFSTREATQARLEELGLQAFHQLNAAKNNEDLEIATRAKILLHSMNFQWIVDSDHAVVKRYLVNYLSRSLSDRLGIVDALRRMPRGEGAAALCRIVQCENTVLVRRYAAVSLIGMRPFVDPKASPYWNQETWAMLVDEDLERPVNQETELVRSYSRMFDESESSRAEYQQKVEAFIQESSQIVGPLQTPGGAVIGSGLGDQNAFLGASDPRVISMLLLYSLADVEASFGDKTIAEEIRTRASEDLMPETAEAGILRLYAAYTLQGWGRIDWSLQELRKAMEVAPDFQKIELADILARLLHDQLQDAEAANVIESLIDVNADDLAGGMMTAGPDGLLGFERKELRAEIANYRASDALRRGDLALHRELIEEALGHDPELLDVVIARHQLEDVDDAYRVQTARMVDGLTREFRADALSQLAAHNPDPHNRLAWLLANTDGDKTLAIDSARKALEMAPDSAAVLDTMAHVRFMRGEYAVAVELQRRAVGLEPWSLLLQETLERFEAKWQEEGGEPAPPTPNN